MKDELSISDVVIEAMPFSDEIIRWCHDHPEFKEALKVSNPDRFYPLGMVQTSTPSTHPEDFIIGFTAYDMISRKFKQDFIVDVGSRHNNFVLYTNLPSKDFGKYVHHINEFYAIYGKNGNYAGTHHFDISTLHALNNTELSERAGRAIKRSAAIMKAGGRRPNSQAELREALRKIREEKARINGLAIERESVTP